MTNAAVLVWIGVACVVAGVFLLRKAWGLATRSPGLNAVAWSLILAGSLSGGSGHGAWGLAVTSLSGMLAASLLLAHAAIRSPAGKMRATNRRAHMLPERGVPLRLGGRVLTFALTVPISLLSALILALGARAAVFAPGGSEADANVLALLVMPLAWAGLLVAILMQTSRRSQIIRIALAAIAGAVMLLIGAIAP